MAAARGGDGRSGGGMHDGDGMGVRGAAPAGCGAEPREENFVSFSSKMINFLNKRDEMQGLSIV